MSRKSFPAAFGLALAIALVELGGLACAATSYSLKLISTFDFPGASIFPAGINNAGDIVGAEQDNSTFSIFGFERFADGEFAPLVDFPGSQTTVATGINDHGLVAGQYGLANGQFFGFFLETGKYDKFDSGTLCGGQPCDTDVSGINNHGDFVGSFQSDDGLQPFVDVGGVATTVMAPDSATVAFFNAIDNGSLAAVGNYLDGDDNGHSFIYIVATRAIALIDIPSATQTFLSGINSQRTLAGYYVDAENIGHGVVVVGKKLLFFDYPGAISTSLTGINDRNAICGSYIDDLGISHGMILRLVTTTTSTP
ncbi:MAG TPA: hypothetical protein VKS22_15085 [Candidatus Binataceae bacterium]|nr:hypothetical protein [Candidatus Binataceae bacterium]